MTSSQLSANLEGLPTAALVQIFNSHTERKVSKFASREIAVRRIRSLLANLSLDVDTAMIRAGLKEAPKPEPKAEEPKARSGRPQSSKRRAVIEAAERGDIPEPPDFSAATHKPYRKRLDVLVELVNAGDIRGLEDVDMLPPRSSSPKALLRYRDMALIALRARAAS